MPLILIVVALMAFEHIGPILTINRGNTNMDFKSYLLKKGRLLLAIVLSLYGCHYKTGTIHERFQTPLIIHCEKIDSDVPIHMPVDLLQSDSLLLLSDYHSDYFLTVLSKNSGRSIKQILKRGQGPHEFIAPIHLGELATENCIYVLERSLSRISLFNKDSLLFAEYPTPFFVKKIACEGLDPIVLSGNYFLSSCEDEKQFVLYNPKGEKVSCLIDYPLPFKNASLDFKQQALQGTLKASRDGKHAVFGGIYSDQLIFFAFDGKEISEKVSYQSYFPDVYPGGDDNPIIFGTNFRPAYLTISVTDNYVYASYNGKQRKHQELPKYSLIYQFDWEGTPIRSYRLFPALVRFSVDERNGSLWGIDYDFQLQKATLYSK